LAAAATAVAVIAAVSVAEVIIVAALVAVVIIAEAMVVAPMGDQEVVVFMADREVHLREDHIITIIGMVAITEEVQDEEAVEALCLAL
jgi:hypothetical protein